MNTIQIRSCFPQDVTILSNEFLDRYMPQANGEFVKIYLYLLRASGASDGDLTIPGIADALNCTDTDVQRAIRYWEGLSVLRVKEDAHAAPAKIDFVNFCNPDFWDGREALQMPAAPKDDAAGRSEKIRITAAQRSDMSAKEEISQLFFIAEQYLGRNLSRTDSDTILYLLSECGFSVDLVDYLIEYCVSIGHKAIGYIKKVAFSWQEAGITTVEEAKAHAAGYQKEYYDIFRALGIKGHSVTAAEKEYMDRWRYEYAFPEDVIAEACRRTILNTGKPSLPYVEGILKNWHEKGLHTMAEIKTDQPAQKRVSPGKHPDRKNAPGRFDFDGQRTYDYEELEKRLLNKGKKD